MTRRMRILATAMAVVCCSALLSPTWAITDEEVKELRISILPEPITALLTIPFVWVGREWWTLAWVLAIPIGILLKRTSRSTATNDG